MASLIEKFILQIAKHKIKPVNIYKHHLYPIFLEYQPLLENCYKQAYYWHGTGRYHYQHLGNSKYEGIDFTQIYDLLQSIIKTGGITPNYDPIVHVNHTYTNSISLSQFRMYARAYAQFNQYEKTKLEYVYGTVKFWFYFLLPLQLLHGNLIQNIYFVLRSLSDKNLVERSQPWVHAFRKPSKKHKWTALNFYKATSDIPTNYGILFGIKESGVHPFSFNRIVERFETRADNLIKLESLSHIEVPINNISETEELLKQNGINIPVIPIEVGELYCNSYSLAYLSGIEE